MGAEGREPSGEDPSFQTPSTFGFRPRKTFDYEYEHRYR